MPTNPPPGPDWILGDDGHWKPPPFDVGVRPGPTPPAAPSPGPWTQTGPQGGPGPQAPQAGWPGQPRWGPQGPLPAAPRKGGSTVGLALGLGGAAVVGIVVVLVLAVTFLGTSAPEESRAERAAMGDGPSGSTGAGGAGERSAGGSTVPGTSDVTLSERAAKAMADQLEPGGWVVVAAEPVPLGDGSGGCHPEGWHEGATDRFRVGFQAAGIGEAEVRTIAYGTEAQAQADLERARSAEQQECIRQAATQYAGAPVDVQALPADATVPGVTYRSTSDGPDGHLVQDDTYIVVGRVRAYVSYCTCRAMDEPMRHALAQQIAIGMAHAQDMPDPGAR